MKKLFLAIGLICLMSSNLFAAQSDSCSCGYTFDMGAGTLTNSILITSTGVKPTSYTGIGTCTSFGAPLYSFSMTSSACIDMATIKPSYVYPMNGIYGDGDDIMVERNVVKAGGAYGSGFVTDFRDASTTYQSYTCPMSITEGTIVQDTWYPVGAYTNSQNAPCQIDILNAGGITNPMGATYSRNVAVFKGYLTGSTYQRKGIELWLEYKQVKTDPTGYPALAFTHTIDTARCEFFDNLRADIDKSGKVLLADFTEWKAMINVSNACRCTGYFK